MNVQLVNEGKQKICNDYGKLKFAKLGRLCRILVGLSINLCLTYS